MTTEKTNKIATYVINLRKRTDRRDNILKEFSGRPEFEIRIVDALEHNIGAIGLWNTLKHILKDLVNEKDEYIIICEDDHQFTDHYSKELLLNCISEAKACEADMLSGGISWFQNAVQISKNLFWTETFSGLQFTVIFRQFYDTILKTTFNDNDDADHKLCAICNSKFVLHPFISTQKEFGYSDVTEGNDREGSLNELFKNSSESMQIIREVASVYRVKKPSHEEIITPDKYEDISIPTFIINLPEEKDRLDRIKNEFAGRNEFDVKIIEAVRDKNSSLGLWESIRKAVQLGINTNEEVIIICRDNHRFTEHYSKCFLFKNIIEAHSQGVSILFGDTTYFTQALPISKDRFFVWYAYKAQFLILYSNIFQKILDEPFDENITADNVLSDLTSNKMILFPFISKHKDFFPPESIRPVNYNNSPTRKYSKTATEQLRMIKQAYEKYGQKNNDIYYHRSS